jgi:hypothetical protein
MQQNGGWYIFSSLLMATFLLRAALCCQTEFVFQQYENLWIHSRSSTQSILEEAHSQAQIREQMSGPEISQYEKTILGCGLWSGLDCETKGSGPIMRTLATHRSPHLFMQLRKGPSI